MTDVLAIVPARGGSKGLPGKNLRAIAGRSLVAWAVDAARSSRHVTRIVGSTDAEDIAAELRNAGAEVPFLRPDTLAQDDTPDVPVFLHALGELQRGGYVPDIVVNVRPTAPLRTGADIDAAIDLLLADSTAPSVKSVSPVSEHPYKMWTLSGTARLEPIRPDWHAARNGDPDAPRQSLPPVFRSNGAVDAVRVPELLRTGLFHPGPVVAYVMDEDRAVDIDDERDLEIARTHLEEMHR